MRTAAGWAMIGVLGAGVVAFGAKEKRFFGAVIPDAAPHVATGTIDPEIAKLIEALEEAPQPRRGRDWCVRI